MIKNKLRFGDVIADIYYSSKINNNILIIFCAGIPGKSNYEEIARKFVENGFSFLHPKYIGTWESFGNFTIKGCKKTIEESIKAIRNQKFKDVFGNPFEISCNKIYLLGHSFGGSISLVVGANHEVDGIISLAPIVDYSNHNKDPSRPEEDLNDLFEYIYAGFKNVFRGISKKEWGKFCDGKLGLNAVDYLDKLKEKNVLLIHGILDISVDHLKTRWFYKRLKNCSKKNIKFIELANTNHSNIKEKAIKYIISWLNK